MAKRGCAAGAAAVALGALPAWGGFVVDSTIFRLDGGTATYNDDFATVDYVRFVVHTPGQVVFDLLSWEFDERVNSPTSGQGVDLNTNGRLAFFDTDIVLFRDDGGPLSVTNVVGENDDSPQAGFGDGSIDPLGRDSYLAITLDPGMYVLAVSASDLTPLRAATGVNPIQADGLLTVVNGETVPSAFGDYRLTVTGDASLVGETIPLPGAAGLAGFAAAACGLAAWSRRSRRTG